ncbi:preprotein translocase subunit YajC [Cryobacterium lactosi]|jgi:preprotein translocase subunit YajC|uniref:Preprotein translocase subunit YajC n=1 Tax=Cryobacterium lactosi TaxID=1259202 RepID=A0A4V6QJ02_9MICO|nr:preprotein translocase subunit YajC [Cryobacterium lactosi]TFD93974.1 preprotein translocase subunit YajC [Cryobacterium lactosi]
MDPLTLVMLAVLALLVFFMFRNGRKRQKDTLALQSKMVAGADVMTNFGLYGTIVSIDEEENKVALEIAPGTIVQIHRQTIARVVESAETTYDIVLPESADADTQAAAGEPEFGQRTAFEPTTEQAETGTKAEPTDTEPKKGDA